MTQEAIAAAKADIEATDDLLALNDSAFDWLEAERLAALPDFDVSEELKRLKAEMRDDG